MSKFPPTNGRTPRIGAGIAVFLEPSTASVEGLVAQLERYCSEAGPALKWWIDDDNERWRDVTPEMLAYPRRRLLESRRRKPKGYWCHVHGGDEDRDAHPVCASLFAYPELDDLLGMLHMWTDDTWGAQALLDRALDLAKALQPHQGYGGLVVAPFASKLVRQDSRQLQFSLAQRFTGLEIADHWITCNAKKDSLATVQWLTMVSDALLGPMGGRRSLEDLPAGVSLHDYGTGVLIQAGAAPTPGDVNEPDSLALYRAVAKKLAPIRVRAPLPLNIDTPQSLGREETIKWYRRLERDP